MKGDATMTGLVYFDSFGSGSPVVILDCFTGAASADDFDTIAHDLYDVPGLHTVARTETVPGPDPANYPVRIDDLCSDLVGLIGDYCGFSDAVSVALCGADEDYRGTYQDAFAQVLSNLADPDCVRYYIEWLDGTAPELSPEGYAPDFICRFTSLSARLNNLLKGE